ncbi:hypothetical protein [Sphingopyxis macrogoltabida]|uniref:Uncharacterized protein n=1 Tax=Sphingopyxis macrogoltabida TaxID=33050 RepID=A0AAC9AZN8_SPHMC|nr:hypothetical protein [Sphingopyxis macrogoltabida]ALJ16715.1 superoxide dismutase, Fe-Mn family [Sphingopyxis macrogoltabida]AMU92939.1 hypothetical protein ATM17_40390 [Sphingopyxis macrogoltabida]
MVYTKPVASDAARIKCMSKRLNISHYENNYSGAVKRFNATGRQFVSLDFTPLHGFTINRPNREQLIAMNSMMLQQLVRSLRAHHLKD